MSAEHDGLTLYRRDLTRHIRGVKRAGGPAAMSIVLRRALDLPFSLDFKTAVVNEADRLLGKPRWRRWAGRVAR